MQTIKVAHFRLTFSRQMFVVAYPRETQEMVFDAHNRAFAFFGGAQRAMARRFAACWRWRWFWMVIRATRRRRRAEDPPRPWPHTPF
jgi:hypothetical protein